MRIEFKKILGIETIHWDHAQWCYELGLDSQFKVPWKPSNPMTISIRQLPVTKPSAEWAAVLIDGVPGLIPSDHWTPHLTSVPAICISFNCDVTVDFHKLASHDYNLREDERSKLEEHLMELAQEAYRALVRFLEAYRSAKCDVDKDAERDIEQAIDATRPMPLPEFLSGLLYKVSNDSSSYSNCMPFGKMRSFVDEEQGLQSRVQKYLDEGTDFAKSRLYEARQLFYDGNLAMATVLSVMALEAKTSQLLDDKLLVDENLKLGLEGFSTPKKQLEELKKETSLIRRLVILMPLLTSPSEVEMRLISDAISARNHVIHHRASKFEANKVAAWIQAIEQLTKFFDEQLA